MPIQDTKDQKKSNKLWKWLLFIVLLIVVIGLFLRFCVSIKHIDGNSIGVKSSINNPVDETNAYNVSTVNGYVVYLPLLTNLKVYPTSVLSYDLGEIKIHTQDGVEFIASPKVALQLDASKAVNYSVNFKEDIDKNPYLKEAIINSIAMATSLYSTDSLIHNKVAYEKQLSDILASKLKNEYFVLLKNVNTNLTYPHEVKDKIELNAKVKQEILVAQTQAQLEYIEADSKRKKDSLEYSTLTKLSIQKLFIDKWDGRLAPNPEQPIMYRDINSNEDSDNHNQTKSQLPTSTKPISQKSNTTQGDSIASRS